MPLPKTKKPAEKQSEDENFRLTDMVVREVSIVDRAANLKTFLITKRAEEAEMAVIKGDSKDKDKDKKPPEDAAAAEDDAEKGKKKKPPIPPPQDDSAVDGKPEPDEDDEPAKRRKAFGMSAESKTKAFDAISKAANKLLDVAKDVSDAPVVDGAESDLLTSEVMSAIDALTGGIGGVEKAIGAKGGAKVAADRVKRVKALADQITALAKEFEGAVDGATSVATGAASTTTVVVDPAMAKQLADLQKRVSEIGKTVGAGNGAAVDGAGGDEEKPFAWPRDMNRPMSGDNVKKSHRFEKSTRTAGASK